MKALHYEVGVIRNEAPSQDDFLLFVREHQAAMIRTAWRILRSESNCEDALQTALLALWKKRDILKKHPNPRALALKVCIDAAWDIRRRAVRAGAREVQLALMEVQAPSTPCAVESHELFETLTQAIDELPNQQRDAFWLRFIESWGYPEIASSLECSIPTARKHVEHARSKLKLRLGAPFAQYQQD